MSSYSPTQPWHEEGQGFGEGIQFPRTYEDDFSYQKAIGYFEADEEVSMNGGVPNVLLGTNRDFQRQPSSPGAGPSHNWNQQYSHNGFREEIPCGGHYDNRMEHGSNHSPQFSDSDHGRMDCHMPENMNNSLYGRGRRPSYGGEAYPQGPYNHHFHNQQDMDHFHENHQQQQTELNSDSSPLYGQQHFNSHYYQPREHEYCQEEFQRRGEIFLPHGPPYPPPHVEDRICSSPFGPRGRTFDPYPSPTLNSSSWNPMCDSPESPIPMPNLPSPRVRGGGGSHPQYIAKDDMPPPPHLPQMVCHNPRVHEKALNPLQETSTPVVRPYRSRLNIRRRESVVRSESSSQTYGSNNKEWNASSETEMSRDPRLTPKALAQKQHRQQVKQLKQDVDIMVNQIVTDHSYCRGRTSKAEGEEEEVVCSNSRILTSPLHSSFLSVVEKGEVVRSHPQERSSSKESGHASRQEVSSSNSEPVSFNPNATSIDNNLKAPCIASTPEVKTVVSQLMANSVICKLLKTNSKPSGSSSKLNYSFLTNPEDISQQISKAMSAANSKSIKGVEMKRTTKAAAVSGQFEKSLYPLVFSLNDFNLDLDTEPSSSEEEAVISVPAANSGSSDLNQCTPQWAITNFDHTKNLIRLTKVEASRIHSSINGRCAANKLVIYASKSSPSACVRMENLTKSILQRRKKLEEEMDGEWEDVETPSPTFEEDDDDDDYTGGGRGNVIPKEKSKVNLRKRRRIGVAKRPGMRSESRERESNSETTSPRNRAEAVTARRRKMMAREVERKKNAMLKDVERRENERLQTSRLQDNPELPIHITASPDLSMDDLSIISISSSPCISATSSPCRDLDVSSVKSLLEEFNPDVVSRCKKISKARSSGDTPLHKVCRTGKYEMARYFILVDSAAVNSQDNAGWTPLHEACCSNHMKVAELLLKSDADANASATDGTRPVHDAIETGNLDLVKLLLQYGADPLAELGEKTPLEHALSNEQHEIHAYLESIIQVRLKSRSQKSSSSSPTVPKKKPTRASRKGEKMLNPAVMKEKRSMPMRDKSDSALEVAALSRAAISVQATSSASFVQDGDRVLMRRIKGTLKLLKMGDKQVSIPVDGYGSDGPFCGEELSYPLFYITPIIELSDCPFLPVYNFRLVSGSNPRHHNFHLISEILNTLNITEEELLSRCDGVVPIEFSVADILDQMDLSSTCHKPPECIMSMPYSKKLQFLPLCDQLRELLDIDVENLDE